jgi:ribosomal protein S18 acetylase RimI-like enzyme
MGVLSLGLLLLSTSANLIRALRVGACPTTSHQRFEDLCEAAALSVDVFYGHHRRDGILAALNVQRLTRIQLGEMEARFLVRGSFQGQTDLFLVRDEGRALVAMAEVFLHEVDHRLAMDLAPEIFRDSVPTSKGTLVVPKIANLVVAPAYRRQGLGSLLVRQCETRARDWGHSHAALYVDEDNPGARDLYRRLGFTEIYADRTEKRFVIQGPVLRLAPVTKTLLVKNILKEDEVSVKAIEAVEPV